jgi:hypothetical protein
LFEYLQGVYWLLMFRQLLGVWTFVACSSQLNISLLAKFIIFVDQVFFLLYGSNLNVNKSNHDLVVVLTSTMTEVETPQIGHHYSSSPWLGSCSIATQ